MKRDEVRRDTEITEKNREHRDRFAEERFSVSSRFLCELCVPILVVVLSVLAVLTFRSALTPAYAAGEPVTLDVVVTDAKSRPLLDLRPSDFELIDSGEPRSVDAVRPQQGGPRVFGIFLDEFNVQSGGPTSRARSSLLNFVYTHLRDGDRVAIVKPLDPLHAIAFTQDRNLVRQVIATFEGHAGDYTPRSDFERNFMSRDPQTA